MASGTFATVKLMRSDHQTPWGFRLQGGQEFQMPLSMVKVSDGSLAEQAGVQVGDIILKINGKECDMMRHKDAQDCIINAGNYLELYLERGPMNTWRPNVTAVGEIEINNRNSMDTNKVFTRTSLAKTAPNNVGGIGSGHNSMPKPFGDTGAGSPNRNISGPKLVHKQFNSPINLYSEKSLEETLNAHSQVLATGATGINFMKPDVPVNKDSAVFKMIQEEEARKAQGLTASPEKNGFHDPTDGPIRHVSAPSGPTRSPGQDERNRNICGHCERLIVGVFVRVNNKSLHPDCFICSTCGTSLKNIGYFNINDKLYCDIHAKQMKQVLSGPPVVDGSSNISPSRAPFTNQAPGSVGLNRISPPSFNSMSNNIPIQQNGFRNTSFNQNTTTTTSSFSSPVAPKKFSSVSVPPPPTAPKPAFGAGATGSAPQPPQSQINRNSMYGGMPSMGTGYNYSTTTHESTTVNQNYAGAPYGAFGAPAAPGANQSGPGYVSSSFTTTTRNCYGQRPKSCFGGFSGPNGSTDYTSFYTSTLPHQKTTTNFNLIDNFDQRNSRSRTVPIQIERPSYIPKTFNKLSSSYYPPFILPKTTATYASQTRTTYSVPPAAAASNAAAPAATVAPGPNVPFGVKIAAPNTASAPSAVAGPRPLGGAAGGAGNQYGAGQTGFGGTSAGAGGIGGLNTGSTAPAKPRGKAFLQSQLTSGGAIPFCGYCSQPIRGQYIMALDKTWCPNHFICSNNLCKRSLEQQGFVEEQGRLYCEQCYETHFAPNCTKCHQRIKGDCLNALDKKWHPECFTCNHCRKPFGNSSFYLEDGLPYCEVDWNNLFTTKCVACGHSIAAGDRWVEAMNQNYHSTCFRCTVCGQTLEGQSFFAKGGRPYCKQHAR